MVTKEQAVAQQQKQLSANQEAKAKQDAIIASSKQNISQNRGYQSESTDRFGNTEVYREPSKTASQDPKALQDNRKAVQAKEDQTKQLKKEVSNLSPQNKIAYNKFLEDTARAGDQKSIDQLRRQGRDVLTVKQGPYERTYIDSFPDDVRKELETGYKDEKGNIQQNYFINPIKSGEGLKDEPVTFESEAQKVAVDKNVSWSNDKLLEGKTRVNETTWSDQDALVKSFGIEKANEFIENRNEIALQNQKVATDYFVAEGKKLGFKDVKITKDGKTEIVPLGDKKLYDFSSPMEFTFVKTPEMIAETKQIRTDQKQFLIDAKTLGYKEIKIKTPTETRIVPIDQAYREIVSSGSAEISPVKSPEMIAQTKQIRKEQKEFVKLAKKSGAEFIKVGSDIVPVSQGYREIIKGTGSEISAIYKVPEEPEISQDGFSQALKRFNKDPYAPPDIVPVKNIENIPENKIYHERKTDLPFEEKVKSGINIFYAGLGGMISSTYNQALPGYDKLVNKLTGNYDKNKISFEPVPVAPARLMYVPESVVGTQTSAIAVSALEAKDLEDFINKTGTRQQDVYQMLSDQPTERTLGQIGSFIAPFFVTKKSLDLIPIRYTRTPISTVVSPYGADYYSKSLRLGYDKFNILLGEKYGITGKISIGKSRPEISGVSIIKGTASKNSFDTYQIGSFTKRQRQDFDPAIKYLEDTGIVGKGDLSKVDPVANIIKQTEKNRSIIDRLTKWKFNPKEVSTTFDKVDEKTGNIEQRLDPEKTTNLITELQKKKMISERGGSPSFNLYETKVQRKIGDWDFNLLKEQSIVYAKILTSGITKEGYSLFAKGSKIVTGVKDSPFWLGTFSIPSGRVISGISSKTGQKVLQEGIKIEDTPRGFYFSTPNMKLALSYVRKKAEGILLEHEWDMSKILRFKDVPKHLRKKLLAYDIDDRVERFYKSQERIKEYAQSLKKGYLGATRPYEPESKFFEIYAWDAKAIKSTKQLEPSGYTIKKGTEREFLNLLDDKDQAKSIVKGLSDRFFGDKFKIKTVKQKTPTGQTMTTQDLFTRMKNNALANSQILDESALLNYRGDATKFGKLFEKTRIRVGYGTLGRIGKDTASNYFFGMRLLAEAAFKSGNRPLAKQIGSVMKMEYEKHKAWGFDWKNEIAQIKQKPISIVKSKPDYSSSVKSFASNTAKQATLKSPVIVSSYRHESKDSMKSSMKSNASKQTNEIDNFNEKMGMYDNIQQLNNENIGNEIVFYQDNRKFTTGIGAVHPNIAGKIGINIKLFPKDDPEKLLPTVLSHETVHQTLFKINELNAGMKLDLQDKGLKFLRNKVFETSPQTQSIYNKNIKLFNNIFGETNFFKSDWIYAENPNFKMLDDKEKNKSLNPTKSILTFKSPSIKSPSLTSTSLKSPSIKSPSIKSSMKSIASIKSPSMKSSMKSIASVKSPSMKSSMTSIASVKSPSMKSPSIKSPSIKSPSLKSPSLKSPSIKSPSLGSPSLKSPSIKSPSLSFPTLKTPPVRSLIIPGIMKFGKHQKSYADIPKYSLTYRFSVKNPVFKKFSINEGKKRKLEW